MKIYPGTSFWDVYQLPIPFRKWFIEEHIKQIQEQEQENRQPRTFSAKSANVPLSTAEKQMISNQIRPMQSSKG